MSNKAIKKRAKGYLRDLEGSYFCFTDQSMAALVSHALISPRCGDSSPHLPLNPPPPSVKLKEEN